MQGTPYPKEQMHRIAYTKLSERQIADKLSTVAASGPTSVSPLSDVLAGKSIRIVTDKGPALAYTFGRNNRLSVAENGGGAVEAGYGALTLNSVAFFSHLIPGTQRGYAVVIDQNTNLATVFELWFSGYEDNREVQREIYYGYVEQSGQEAPKARHVDDEPRRGQGLLLEAGHWRGDAGVLSLGGVLELCRTFAAGRRTRVLRAVRLHQDQRRPLSSTPAPNASSPAPSPPT